MRKSLTVKGKSFYNQDSFDPGNSIEIYFPSRTQTSSQHSKRRIFFDYRQSQGTNTTHEIKYQPNLKCQPKALSIDKSVSVMNL